MKQPSKKSGVVLVPLFYLLLLAGLAVSLASLRPTLAITCFLRRGKSVCEWWSWRAITCSSPASWRRSSE